MSLVRRFVSAALHRTAAAAGREAADAPPADELPPAAGWHESSYDLRCGLEVIELDFAAA